MCSTPKVSAKRSLLINLAGRHAQLCTIHTLRAIRPERYGTLLAAISWRQPTLAFDKGFESFQSSARHSATIAAWLFLANSGAVSLGSHTAAKQQVRAHIQSASPGQNHKKKTRAARSARSAPSTRSATPPNHSIGEGRAPDLDHFLLGWMLKHINYSSPVGFPFGKMNQVLMGNQLSYFALLVTQLSGDQMRDSFLVSLYSHQPGVIALIKTGQTPVIRQFHGVAKAWAGALQWLPRSGPPGCRQRQPVSGWGLPEPPLGCSYHMATVQHQWDTILGAPPILEPILVVGLGCSLGVRGVDPWPYHPPTQGGTVRGSGRGRSCSFRVN